MNGKKKFILLSSAGAMSAALALPASAQDAPAPAPTHQDSTTPTNAGAAAGRGGPSGQDTPVPGPAPGLEDIIVTATRSASTVNKVALSVSAVSQQAMISQGIKNVDDITRTVPGMTFRSTSTEGNPSITLRGIGGYSSLVGAATTGIYLDDTSLTQRNLNGARTGNGSPFPQLFDLDRVEVLRGPQGTLYGGSSEGGTVRFITPTPSLKSTSGQFRSELSFTDHGSPTYELAEAYGAPLIQDKLGIRVSGIVRREGGSLDAKSVFDGHTFAKDVNWREQYAGRATLRWAATSTLTVTPAMYYSRDYSNNPDTFWLATPQLNYAGGTAYNGAPAPELGAAYTNGACSTQGSPTPAARPCSNSVNGATYYYAFPNTTIAPHVQAATPWYDGYSTGNGNYTNANNPVFVASPRTTYLMVPSLSLENDFGFMTAKSISSYIHNTTKGTQYQGLQGSSTFRYISRYMVGAVGCDPSNPNTQPRSSTGTPLAGGLCYQNGLYVPGVTDYQDFFNYRQQRNEFTEEVRFSSNNADARFTWVLGGYYSNSHLKVRSDEETNDNIYTQRIRGVPIGFFAGAYGLPAYGNPANPLSPPAAYADISDRKNTVDERELSVFGEANFKITDKLKITAGLRYADYRQRYTQIYGGYQAGSPPALTNPYVPNGFVPSAAALQAASRDPTKPNSATNPIVNPLTLVPFPTDLAGCPTSAACPLQYTDLRDHEKTKAPKFGVSYQATENDLIYATYAKGFRPGGVNPPLPPITCAIALQQLGLTSSPLTYGQDHVDSYEIGSKLRLFGNRVQLNSSAFLINWVDMQYTLSGFTNCGFQLIVNAAQSRSTGAELSANGRFGPLTLGANVGYNKAVFREDVKNQAGIIYANKGDSLGNPDWTVEVNGQANFYLGRNAAYIRADYSYTGKYQRGPGVGTSTYDAYITNGDPISFVNARAGMSLHGVDLAVFVLNLTNTHTYSNLAGGTTTTADPALSTATSIRPRTIGLQTNYRF